MNLGHYLFSFSGRINRAKQWAFLLVVFAFETLCATTIGAIIGLQPILDVLTRKVPLSTLVESNQAKMTLAVLGLLYLIFIYIDLAVRTKRLHDRDKSAWWLLVFIGLPFVFSLPSYVLMGDSIRHMAEVMKAVQQNLPPPPMSPGNPLVSAANGLAAIIGLWAIVEFYFLRGTVGDNRYGPDPLAH